MISPVQQLQPFQNLNINIFFKEAPLATDTTHSNHNTIFYDNSTDSATKDGLNSPFKKHRTK